MPVPQFMIFEGGDGSGKTSLLDRTEAFIRKNDPKVNLRKAWFPGKDPETIGGLIYEIHHGRLKGTRKPDEVALQILHMAAHVDQARSTLLPHLKAGGHLLLDRSWWSTYAYSRRYAGLSADASWELVQTERPFWTEGPAAVFFFLRREQSLKPDESNQETHRALLGYYQEVIDRQRAEGVVVHVIDNNGTEEQAFNQIQAILGGGPHDQHSSKLSQ